MQLSEHSEPWARILIVDDNPTNLLLLARSLEKAGYTILQARDGAAAIEAATTHNPDLVLLDIMMPDQDGLQVCQVLKSQAATETIPVIFVTARTESEEIVKALSIGGCDYITKPFIISEVLARVSVHLRLKRAEQELLRRYDELQRLSSQLADMNIELSRLTRTDPLTGLMNRRAWHEAAAIEQGRSQRKSCPFSVLMIDIDCFKKLNDSLGHQAGDDCLAQLAQGIQIACRCTDLVGRYGGEEFVVLAPETDTPGAVHLAERIRTAVSDLHLPHPDSGIGPYVTVSTGVATGVGDKWEDVVRRADKALYAAKNAGRNRTYMEPGSGAEPEDPFAPVCPAASEQVMRDPIPTRPGITSP
jgi:diguanylate cyclase (GGDEF)-like protein